MWPCALLISTCSLIALSDAVEPPRSSRVPTYTSSRNRGREGLILAQPPRRTLPIGNYLVSSDMYDDFYRRHQKALVRRNRIVPKFTPSITSCCNVGERAAKKGAITCDIAVPDARTTTTTNNNNNNNPREATEGDMMAYVFSDVGSEGVNATRPSMSSGGTVLLARLERCARSKYIENMTKCCMFRYEFNKQMDSCRRQHRKGRDRKNCRARTRTMFGYINN